MHMAAAASRRFASDKPSNTTPSHGEMTEQQWESQAIPPDPFYKLHRAISNKIQVVSTPSIVGFILESGSPFLHPF